MMVEFLAKWSEPCKAIAPTLEIMAENYQNVTMIKVTAWSFKIDMIQKIDFLFSGGY